MISKYLVQYTVVEKKSAETRITESQEEKKQKEKEDKEKRLKKKKDKEELAKKKAEEKAKKVADKGKIQTRSRQKQVSKPKSVTTDIAAATGPSPVTDLTSGVSTDIRSSSHRTFTSKRFSVTVYVVIFE